MSYIIHYSIDDVIEVFRELATNHPKSIFEVSLFSFFRDLHQKYDLVLSYYCFFKKGDFTLSEVPRSYRQEFEENSSWLRFGFHGYTGAEDYDIQNVEESIKQYTLVMENLKEIVGENSLDAMPRIHRFHASREFVNWLGNNKVFCLIGLLSADDNRNSYSLEHIADVELKCKHIIKKENMIFLQTTQRFDGLKPRMVKRLFTNMGGQNIFFTHEWLLLRPSSLKLKVKSVIIKMLMKMVCRFYTKKGYVFAFPMEIKIK